MSFENLFLKYEVAKPKSPDGLFYKNLSMRPWLVYTIVNLVSLLSLTAIGFGVGIGISSRCKFEVWPAETKKNDFLNLFLFQTIKIQNFMAIIVPKRPIAYQVKILFVQATNVFALLLVILMAIPVV